MPGGAHSGEGYAGMGRDFQGIRGSEGNAANISPAPFSPGKPVRVLDMNLHHPRPPLNVLSPSPFPPTPHSLFWSHA